MRVLRTIRTPRGQPLGMALAPADGHGAASELVACGSGERCGWPIASTASGSGHEAEEDALRPKLLIVEDDPAMRTVWQVVFGSRGWDVSVATTAAEGLASLDPPPTS